MFSALSLLVLCFLFFFEALVLARSLSFGNLVSRSCSTYFDKETTFSLLQISFSSSVSHETMADFIVSFNCNREEMLFVLYAFSVYAKKEERNDGARAK